MSESWKDAVLARLDEGRRGIQQVVNEVPAEAWKQPSAYEGWTYHDQLSHLADRHRAVQSVMRAIIEGRTPDLDRFDRLNEANEEIREKYLSTPVPALLADFLQTSKETQGVVREVDDAQAETNLGQFTLRQALEEFSMHDGVHLYEIRKALQT